MKHYRHLLFLVLFCSFFSNSFAQQFKLGGMLKTSSRIDSLVYQDNRVEDNIPQGFLTKFTGKTGKLRLNVELNILHLSHLRPIDTEALVSEHTVLTQKRTQFQIRLGLVILLKNSKTKKN